MKVRKKQLLERAASGNGRLNSEPARVRPRLATDSLISLIRKGDIDTVIMVFPDIQGRWLGKRVSAPYFLDTAINHGIHACNYLLTTDMEMETLPGFDFASWDKGYRDLHMTPDTATFRLLPWLEKTALIICNVEDENGKPVEISPRQILKRQIKRAKELGFYPKMGSELEFYLFKETYDSARDKNYHNLVTFGSYIEDYHILQGTKEEVVNRDIRNMMEEARVPVEFSKGEWGPGQHEINLRYADALEMADRHTIYKHGAKEIAMSKGLALTFMAKYDTKLAGSSFHLHSSLWNMAGAKSLFWQGDKPSNLFRHWLAGQMALAGELSFFFAPTVNSYKRYQSTTFAPTKIAWGHDNRTCGFRIVGHGPSYRVENRIPGADANPYLAFAATIAAGLYGIKNKLEPPPEFKGNAYKAERVAGVPGTLHEAVENLEKSRAAEEAFGEKVVKHCLHYAKLESAAFEKSVTCWERERYFERI